MVGFVDGCSEAELLHAVSHFVDGCSEAELLHAVIEPLGARVKSEQIGPGRL
jgi:hypothetical protein